LAPTADLRDADAHRESVHEQEPGRANVGAAVGDRGDAIEARELRAGAGAEVQLAPEVLDRDGHEPMARDKRQDLTYVGLQLQGNGNRDRERVRSACRRGFEGTG
jgi:hypothetical protein